jgi:hypothetical protein
MTYETALPDAIRFPFDYINDWEEYQQLRLSYDAER